MTDKFCYVCGLKRPRRDWQFLGWSAIQIWKPVKFYGTFCPKHSEDEPTVQEIVDKLKGKPHP